MPFYLNSLALISFLLLETELFYNQVYNLINAYIVTYIWYTLLILTLKRKHNES
jgi:hypothetical protein